MRRFLALSIVIAPACVIVPAARAQSAAATTVPASKEPAGRPPGDFVFGVADPAVRQALADPNLDPSRRLWLDVALGRWDGVRDALAAMPPAEATAVHARIVVGLSARSAGALAPDDVAALVAALPPQSTPNRGQVEAIGKLLGRALGDAPVPPSVMARFGATAADPRRLAALTSLLVAAGRAEDAATLLPSAADVAAGGDATLADVYVDVRTAALKTRDASGPAEWQPLPAFAADAAARGQTTLSPLEAAARIMTLAAAADAPAFVVDWLGRLPADRRESFARAAASLAAMPNAPAQSTDEPTLRASRLKVRLAVLARSGEAHAADLACAAWSAEAAFTLAPRSPAAAVPPANRGDPDATMSTVPAKPPTAGARPLAAAIVRGVAPAQDVLAAASPAVRQATLRDRFRLEIADGAFDVATNTLAEIATIAPSSVRGLSAELIDGFARAVGPAYEIAVTPTASRKVMLPVARAMQADHVARLAAIAARLRTLAPDAVPAAPLVDAFVALHGRAGGFSSDELAAVFGPPASIDADALGRLVVGWRNNLFRATLPGSRSAGAAADEATSSDALSEYRQIESLRRARADAGGDWRIDTQLGLTLFAEGEYLRQFPKAGLSPATYRRDALDALDALARAASRSDAATEAYVQWFHCAIGLANPALTAVGELIPDHAELAKIRDAIAAVSADRGPRLRAAIGEAMTTQGKSVGAQRVASYARAALAVVGDEPAAKPLRDAIAYYDALAAEVRLTCAVDGDPAVGVGAPFGIRVMLDTTEQLDREVGGFAAKILAGRSNQPQQIASMTGRFDYRSRLQESIRRAWGEQLEIVNVLWAPAGEAAGATDDPAWRRNQIAYVLAKAKSAGVDRLPPVQMDLDFGDRNNAESVVLPFVSPPVTVDASRRNARAFRPLTVQHVLNDYEAASGTVTDEITVTAAGLVPAFDEMLKPADGGWRAAKVEDRGLVADRYAASAGGGDVTIQTRRTWLVTYDVPADAKTFAFPALAPAASAASPKVEYRRYSGSDVVAVGDRVPLSGRGTGVGAIVAVAAAIAWMWRRRRARAAVVDDASDARTLTTFAALQRLVALRADEGGRLSAADRDELAQQIRALQASYADERSRRLAATGRRDVGVAPRGVGTICRPSQLTTREKRTEQIQDVGGRIRIAARRQVREGET